MTDVLGWRRKFGCLGPSTNTIVQPDFDDMRPVGVTNHYARIFTPDAQAVSNESFRAGVELIGTNVIEAVRSIMTCAPDYLVLGMSAVTFFGGAKGAERFQQQVVDESGLAISMGSIACAQALQAYGGVRKLAVLSPYWPVMHEEVGRFFADMGFRSFATCPCNAAPGPALQPSRPQPCARRCVNWMGMTSTPLCKLAPISRWFAWLQPPKCGLANL